MPPIVRVMPPYNQRVRVARPLPGAIAWRVCAVAAVLAIAWLRDTIPVPGAPVLAALAFLACALMGRRLIGIAIPVGPLPMGVAAGLAGAALFLALPVLTHQGPWRGPGWWLPLAAVVSVGEELAARGLVFGLLEPAGAGVAMSGSALIFGAMHLVPYPVAALPLLLAAGLVLGYLRWVTRGLLAPAVAHVLANAVAAAA